MYGHAHMARHVMCRAESHPPPMWERLFIGTAAPYVWPEVEFVFSCKKIRFQNKQMPIDLTHEGLNTPQNIRLYLSLAEIGLGIAVQTLNYSDVRRVLIPDGESASVNGDSELGRVLVEDAKKLCEGSDIIYYVSGLATLFATGSVQRSLAPKILLCWDLRDSAKLVGIANVCYFACEEALGTEALTRAYCDRHSLPNFEAHWFFLDVFCSIRSPAGSLLVVNAMLIASRQRSKPCPGLAGVAISEQSLKVFKKLQFSVHEFRSHGSKRWLVWKRLDQFSMEPLLSRLRFANNEYLVRNICYRRGATAASHDRIMKHGC